VGEAGDFKFGTQVDCSNSQLKDVKSSLKWAWLRHVTHFTFWGPIYISGMAEPRIVKFCTQVGYIKSYQTNEKSYQNWRGYGQVTHLIF